MFFRGVKGQEGAGGGRGGGGTLTDYGVSVRGGWVHGLFSCEAGEGGSCPTISARDNSADVLTDPGRRLSVEPLASQLDHSARQSRPPPYAGPVHLSSTHAPCPATSQQVLQSGLQSRCVLLGLCADALRYSPERGTAY
ncbi:hypothetical protein AAFF_G00147020 [Aldrovandia affinis]|uniref:Uncharacterized protein n=1 Tax=Aldrovandia affinis TaxID=143900 RepID=A0AAD7RPR5_9TELE|nr:hypothetical protein AAFF_G00147020 [Aldrovandia affinis]